MLLELEQFKLNESDVLGGKQLDSLPKMDDGSQLRREDGRLSKNPRNMAESEEDRAIKRLLRREPPPGVSPLFELKVGGQLIADVVAPDNPRAVPLDTVACTIVGLKSRYVEVLVASTVRAIRIPRDSIAKGRFGWFSFRPGSE